MRKRQQISKDILLKKNHSFFRSVKGLVGFTKLKELVLDNNNLSDDVEFPEMISLETLTLNKNNVSFSLLKIVYV